MTSAPRQAPQKVIDLVNHFSTQLDDYKAGKYNETQLRRDFLDPLFKELGWDMYNEQQFSERYREVIDEMSVEVEGKAKAADYAFRLGGNTVFFLEAKKPAVNVGTSQDAAFQIRRYAWSAKVPVSLVSDFEQLAIYDCRNKPKHSDAVHVGRVELYHYTDFISKWDEIYNLFSKEAVQKGAFDKFAEGLKGKRGTADVDDDFLVEMERWREALARNIALRNPDLGTRQINAAVQLTIDRIIFLRICEERGIEAEDALRNATDGIEVYEDLMVLFEQADKKYNSGLFHFHDEKNQSSYPDTLTPYIKIDDKVLKDILANLYYPKCPYAFNYISADILGQVYERFLGKVIRLTSGHQAKVEEKPEVRKAGGVYYTPTYIVEYIVKNTVGELLKDKSPADMEKAPLRVLDPSCGSGSFLLGAYQYLLDWYLEWYENNDPHKWSKGKNPKVIETTNGWQLTMEQKKEILTGHIFGVDIDAQAVEVTKLSLLLKVVENPGQLSWLAERILPDLSKNIQCGNSLIGPDYYEGQQMTFLDEEEQYRVNAFDWQQAFPQVFREGGFGAMIGNPPYIRIQAMKESAPKEVEFYKQKYKTASKGNYDIYVVFVEKGLSLLNNRGRLGFILPNKFFTAQYGEPLRDLLSSGQHLDKIVYFNDLQIFSNATTYTCLLFLTPLVNDQVFVEDVKDLDQWRNEGSELFGLFDSKNLSMTEWNFVIGEFNQLFQKLTNLQIKLSDISSRIFQGLITGADKVFILTNKEGNYFSEQTKKTYSFENNLLHALCKGSVNIRRYHISEIEKSILFPYKIEGNEAILLSKKELETLYPNIWNYLKENQSVLESREHGKWKHEKWYAFGRTQNLGEMEQIKILTPSIANRSSFTLDNSDFYYFVGSGGGGGGGYGITLNDNKYEYEYILGILNSKLIDKFIKAYSTRFSGGYYAYNRQYIEQIPIRTIDFNNPADKAYHERMVSLVQSMLDMHKQIQQPLLPQEKERLQRQIDWTDREIDKLVYELYGLTDEEIRIVEGNN